MKSFLQTASFTLTVYLLVSPFALRPSSGQADDFLVLTVVQNEKSPSFRRWLHSAQFHRLPIKVITLDGSGQRPKTMADLLKHEIRQHRKNERKILLYADSQSVLFNSGVGAILERFHNLNASVVFAAGRTCSSHQLAHRFPSVAGTQRFLVADLFMGFANALHRLLSTSVILKATHDHRSFLQTLFNEIYTNETMRIHLNLTLDYHSDLFQDMQSIEDDVEIRFNGREPYVYNRVHETIPLVVRAENTHVHKMAANYIPNGWNPLDGCHKCREDVVDLARFPEQEYPTVLLGFFVDQPTPLVDECFAALSALDYPKSRVHLFVYIAVDFHVRVRTEANRHSSLYKSLKVIKPADNITHWQARNLALEECVRLKCDYYFYVDPAAHVENPKTLRILIEQNRPVVAPLLVQPDLRWANFWGSITPNLQFARSIDYDDIIQNKRRGLWQVPHVQNCYLVKGDVIRNANLSYQNQLLPLSAMTFCARLRDADVDIFVNNRHDFGHLLDSADFQSLVEYQLHRSDGSLLHFSLYWFCFSTLMTLVVGFCLLIRLSRNKILQRNTIIRRIVILRRRWHHWPPKTSTAILL